MIIDGTRVGIDELMEISNNDKSFPTGTVAILAAKDGGDLIIEPLSIEVDYTRHMIILGNCRVVSGHMVQIGYHNVLEIQIGMSIPFNLPKVLVTLNTEFIVPVGANK